MKRLHFAAIALAAGLTLCGTACKPSASGRSADTADSTAQDTFATDSVAFTYDKADGIKCTIGVDYPQGNDSLAEGTKQFIARELAALYLPYNDTDDAESQSDYPLYKGNTTDGRPLVDHYGNGTVRFLTEARKQLEEARLEKHDMPTLSQITKISLEEVKPAYITYRISSDSYLGGAHHSYTAYCRNISRKTNRPVDCMIDTAKLRDMQPLLRKNVLRCVKASGVEGVTDATLDNYIILPDDGLVPLPVCTPWIEGDSLKFVYQPYEIASYAVGTISFGIAAKDIKPFLGKEAAGLLAQ